MHSFVKVESLEETRCRKSWNQFKGVRFTESTLRHASIREKKGPSLGKIKVKNPHVRSPYAVKFEDRSHEETERQKRCAPSKALNLAKKYRSSKKKYKAAFYFSRGGMGTPGCVNKRAGGKIVCSGFREQDHPEFPLQETESPKRGSVSS